MRSASCCGLVVDRHDDLDVEGHPPGVDVGSGAARTVMPRMVPESVPTAVCLRCDRGVNLGYDPVVRSKTSRNSSVPWLSVVTVPAKLGFSIP